ncbi:MAG: chromophore lyase CpcT/CpeT [Phycisphaerales bacterium]|nr:chromophore lyase CpcT/CpeT [Phycisphaerales bacterium]
MNPDRTEQLTQYLTGTFSSIDQSIEDPEYFEIVLNMIPIWQDRNDGPWLYVEQAVASAMDNPYRQRVYHLERSGSNEYISTVYSFENPLEFAGAFKESTPLSTRTPTDLSLRTGCAIRVAWDENEKAFIGSTNGRDCQSSLRGSTYATSEVFLHLDRLITWDRGFDDNDEHVWGAVKGGYIFDRIN